MNFQKIYKKAHLAGLENAKKTKALGNGYVYIKVYNDFKDWAIANKLAEKDYARGWVIIVNDLDEYGSVTKKEAYADAFSKVLTENKIKVNPGVYLT
jgi:hypothetical protein